VLRELLTLWQTSGAVSGGLLKRLCAPSTEYVRCCTVCSFQRVHHRAELCDRPACYVVVLWERLAVWWVGLVLPWRLSGAQWKFARAAQQRSIYDGLTLHDECCKSIGTNVVDRFSL
jgi:hypothetical protein